MNEQALFSASDTVETSVADVMPQAIERSIATWLKGYLADLLDLSLGEIDEDTTFDRYGLDSLATVGMISDLGSWLNYELDAATPNDSPSILLLARELAADEKVRAAYVRRFGREVS
jgi:acyl carrier protein